VDAHLGSALAEEDGINVKHEGGERASVHDAEGEDRSDKVPVHLDGDRQCRCKSVMDSGTACTEPGQCLGEHSRQRGGQGREA